LKVSTKQVKELREKTGVGIMDCKNAIQDAGGDINKAVEILRKEAWINTDKIQLERGVCITVNTGPLKGAEGEIKRVDKKKGTVCVQIDGGLITNTYKTHTMSLDNVTLNKDYYAWLERLNKKEW